MKKIIFATTLSISAMFAFDVGGALKSVGASALSGNTEPASLLKGAAGSAITPDALGGQLANAVKSTGGDTGSTTMDKAKELCSQASMLKTFTNFGGDLMTKAIDICSEQVAK